MLLQLSCINIYLFILWIIYIVCVCVCVSLLSLSPSCLARSLAIHRSLCVSGLVSSRPSSSFLSPSLFLPLSFSSCCPFFPPVFLASLKPPLCSPRFCCPLPLSSIAFSVRSFSFFSSYLHLKNEYDNVICAKPGWQRVWGHQSSILACT